MDMIVQQTDNQNDLCPPYMRFSLIKDRHLIGIPNGRCTYVDTHCSGHAHSAQVMPN